MAHWWEIANDDQAAAPRRMRAVAYYRHSAQDRQENSIPLQRDQVTEWAAKNGVDIVREFLDPGRSGLNAEGRPGFTEMMDEWVPKRDDFDFVLCLDVSRWGRFQDFDLSAQYSAECKKHGKQVIYTNIGMPKEDDPLYQVFVQFERFRAAQYSRELSDKVWRGCVRIIGPVNVVRKSSLGEISFVDLGADGQTSANVAANKANNTQNPHSQEELISMKTSVNLNVASDTATTA